MIFDFFTWVIIKVFFFSEFVFIFLILYVILPKFLEFS